MGRDLAIGELGEFLSGLPVEVELVVHDWKQELQVLWSLGLNAKFTHVFDTKVAVSCLWMGQQKVGSRNTVGDFEDDPVGMVERQNLASNEWQEKLSLESLSKAEPGAAATPTPRDTPQKKLLTRTPKTFGTRQDSRLVQELDLLEKLYPEVKLEANNHGLTDLLTKVEFPFAEAIAAIEWNGLGFSLKRQQLLATESRATIRCLNEKLQEYGITKPGSHDQFEQFLAEANLLQEFTEVTKQGKRSQRQQVLRTKTKLHPAIQLVYQQRSFTRILRLWGLPQPLSKDLGRLHPVIIQNGSSTGRSVTRYPTLTNMEAKVQPLIVPSPGSVILEFDFKSYELVVLAAYFGEESLLAMYYLESKDVYQEIGKKYFPEVDLDSKGQRLIKIIILALVNGLTARGLASKLRVTEAEAQGKIDIIHAAFPKIAQGLENYANEAIRLGYAPIVGGLRRYIPFAELSPWSLRSTLYNTPSQGTAAVIFKLAVARVSQHYIGKPVKIILLKHDSIVMEFPRSMMEGVKVDVDRLMIEAGTTILPNLILKVEIDDQETEQWGSLAEFQRYIEEVKGARQEVDSPRSE
jgi:DNA polymerase I-like protein with 3'-5' exonuclease and polymerase domains